MSAKKYRPRSMNDNRAMKSSLFHYWMLIVADSSHKGSLLSSENTQQWSWGLTISLLVKMPSVNRAAWDRCLRWTSRNVSSFSPSVLLYVFSIRKQTRCLGHLKLYVLRAESSKGSNFVFLLKVWLLRWTIKDKHSLTDATQTVSGRMEHEANQWHLWVICSGDAQWHYN